MNDHLRTRLGAVLLALVTLAAIIFAALNFQQRSHFVLPDDGVTWMDTAQGVTAWHIVPGSPADRAGMREGDEVQTVAGVPIHRATDATRILFRSGPWTEVHYGIRRNGESLDVPRGDALRRIHPRHAIIGKYEVRALLEVQGCEDDGRKRNESE